MANSANRIFVSPGVYTSESDFTFSSQQLGLTSLGIAGETPKGPAFQPTLMEDYATFTECFGKLNQCKFPDSQQVKYEANYIAKQFLRESNQLYITRILGLSGFNAGTAWLIRMGATLDLSTTTVTGTSTFTLTKVYNDGDCESVVFSDSVLQELYDRGVITCDEIGTSTDLTGTTVSISDRYYGNCEVFTGADLDMSLTTSNEPFLCITGSTTTGTTVEQSTTVATGTTIFSAGTITENAILLIVTTCSTTVINTASSTVHIVNSGTIQFNGGTITHQMDGSILLENGTVFLPNGDILSGGTYKVCDLSCATVSYVGCPEIGSGFTCLTGSSVTIQNVFVTGNTNIITKIPSGIVEQTWTGSTNHFSGQPLAEYDNRLLAILRSTASYDSDEILNFDVTLGNLGITPIGKVIRPHDEFKLIGVKSNMDTFEYTISFDPTKRNYIKRVFGEKPFCCTTNSPIWIESMFETMLKKYIDNDWVYCIKPELVCCNNLWDYQQSYKGAVTPWIVSEKKGNGVSRLFRFHTIGDGDAANSDIKISISNIKPDLRTFDVLVRRYEDTDKRPVVLQRFTRLTMTPNSPNYIGRRIGTIDGEFEPNGLCYISVEIAAECLYDSFPAGFEGYPVRDFCDSVQRPVFCYKTCYGALEKARRIYLGISDTTGWDKDFFNYKGVPVNSTVDFWTGTTKGYHLDSTASAVTIDGTSYFDNVGNQIDPVFEFETGCAPFQNEADLQGTAYENIVARKFTLVPYGGFDGWDIHRDGRTNIDTDAVGGVRATAGLISGSYKTYINTDNDTVVNSDYYAYLEAIRTFKNPEAVNINLFTTPGINLSEHSSLVEDVIDMIETERCDSLYIVTSLDYDTALQTIEPETAVDEIDGLYDSNFTATYWPWGQYFDTENNVNVWLPATAEVVRNMAYTDKVAAPWWATAGVNRGQTQFKQSRIKLTQENRDDLYEGRMNPLLTSREYGVLLWGNKTLQIAESALDRINVRRLLLQARKLISVAALQLLFDQNDDIIRTQFLNLINPILENIRQERGLLDFRVEVDSIDDSGDTNQLCGNIYIRPTRAVEVICIGFNLTNAGAEFDNV